MRVAPDGLGVVLHGTGVIPFWEGGGGGPGLTPSDPSVQEELEFCERLLQLCFETPTEESTMDR